MKRILVLSILSLCFVQTASAATYCGWVRQHIHNASAKLYDCYGENCSGPKVIFNEPTSTGAFFPPEGFSHVERPPIYMVDGDYQMWCGCVSGTLNEANNINPITRATTQNFAVCMEDENLPDYVLIKHLFPN